MGSAVDQFLRTQHQKQIIIRNVFIEPKLSSTFFGQPSLLSSYGSLQLNYGKQSIDSRLTNTYTYMGST